VLLAVLAAQWASNFARVDDAGLSVALLINKLMFGSLDSIDPSDAPAIEAYLRTQMAAVTGWLKPYSGTDVKVSTLNVTARDGASLHVRRYSPTRSQSVGAIVYFHGGGWVLGCSPGMLLTNDDGLAALSARLSVDVFSVDYRCAPAHRFPTAAHDAIDAYCFIAEHAKQLGVDASKLGVGGQSAGGNLAVVAALSFDAAYASKWGNRCAASLAPKVLLPEVPVLDSTATSPSHSIKRPVGILDLKLMTWLRTVYAPESRAVVDPLLSPLLADAAALKRLPPTLVVTASYDILGDDSARFVAAVGAHAKLVVLANTPHEFSSMPGPLYRKEKMRVVEERAAWWQTHVLKA